MARGLAPAAADECLPELAASVSERVERYFADLPDGYKADEGARAKSDSWTYGEILTSDILQLAAQARPGRSAAVCRCRQRSPIPAEHRLQPGA